ncbi:MAG TPA: peptidase S41, partial [Anaeromyxobacteraceae bacterium]|nr:peptidase S41 [Anaeromyxobacteraceae bacterium]
MMKPLLAALLLSATSAALAAGAPTPTAAPQPAAPVPPPDPCDGLGRLEDDGACGDSPLCGQRARVKLACSVRDALEQRYVFYPVKGRMLEAAAVRTGFDARAHLGACIAGERAIEKEDDPLRFYDRMRRCVAGFEDGHLLLGAPVRLPQVALGVGLRLVGGKVHIANRERKLVSYLKTVSGVRELDAILAVGNEVLAIDG